MEVCARIAKGFIERESDIVIVLTAGEFHNEATLCKKSYHNIAKYIMLINGILILPQQLLTLILPIRLSLSLLGIQLE